MAEKRGSNHLIEFSITYRTLKMPCISIKGHSSPITFDIKFLLFVQQGRIDLNLFIYHKQITIIILSPTMINVNS